MSGRGESLVQTSCRKISGSLMQNGKGLDNVINTLRSNDPNNPKIFELEQLLEKIKDAYSYSRTISGDQTEYAAY